MPVTWLLTHQSGLSRLMGDMLPVEASYDWDLIVGKLAQQKPLWEPGTQSGYHSVTFGFQVGEVILLVSGKTVGTFLREEVAEPLGADFHLGLGDEHFERVAELSVPPPRPPSPIRPSSNPTMPLIAGNTAEWRRAEIPAANGHGNARSVARVMSALDCGGGWSPPFERGGHRQRNPRASLWQRPDAQRSIGSGRRLYARLQRTALGHESSHFQAHRSGRFPGHGRPRRSCFLELHHEPSAHALQR